MTKPFDIKELAQKYKELGLPVVEDTTEKLLDATFKWLSESAAIHENAIVKLTVPLAVQTVQPLLIKLVDKIDGHEG